MSDSIPSESSTTPASSRRASGWIQRYVLLALLVLAAGLAVTCQLWRTSVNREFAETELGFDNRVREVIARIEHRMESYEQMLRSTAGFMAHADSLDQHDFRDFVANLQLAEKYPGIQGMVFARIVPAAQKEQHVAAIRNRISSSYTIYPAGERSIYTPVIYIEPFSAVNQRAFGHDPYTDPVRRAAMNMARDLDAAVITGKVVLVQENDKRGRAGFMMYQPVFKSGMPHRTIAERRAALIGWVGAPFRMSDLMTNLLGRPAAHLDIDIFDGAAIAADALMYDPHDVRLQARPRAGMFQAVRSIRIANHTWTAQIRSLPGFDAGLDHTSPRILAVAGTGISLLLALLTLILANGRERALQTARRMNRELLESETRYRQMFENNASIACLLEPASGRIIDVNAAAAAFWGYSREQLRTMNIADIATASQADTQHTLREVCEGKREHGECRHRLKSGAFRDVEIFSGPLLYQGKTLIYSILHDISARKQAEKALEESEARWKFALEGAGEGVWDWNLATNEAQYSMRWKAMLGYAEHEIRGTIGAWERLVHPDDKERVLAENRACMEGKMPYICEYRMQCRDGSWKWILARGMVISRDAAGRPLRAIGTHSDVTDRKHAERVQMHKIIDAAPDPMLLVGHEGKVGFANRAAESAFGYAPNEMSGLAVDNLVPAPLRSRHAQLRRRFEDDGDARALERRGPLTATRKDGTEFPAEVSLSQFEMDGEAVVIASIRDVTERQQAARLLQQSLTQLRRLSDHEQYIKENERKRIAQDIHDELGQNLLVLKMDVAALCARTDGSHPRLNRRAALVLENIDASLQAMKTIMNDLRPATLELGLHPAVEWQLKQFERMTGIVCTLATRSPDTEFCLDESQTVAVFRILQESLTNIARHAHATQVEIRLTQDQHGFSMTVADNGQGFEPGDGWKNNSFGLMGMRERTQSLGGELAISSSPGTGTALSISIPLNGKPPPVQSDAAAPLPEPAPGNQPACGCQKPLKS